MAKNKEQQRQISDNQNVSTHQYKERLLHFVALQSGSGYNSVRSRPSQDFTKSEDKKIHTFFAGNIGKHSRNVMVVPFPKFNRSAFFLLRANRA